MIQRDEASTDLGKIKIHKDVIAAITSLAACQVDGVRGLGKNFRSRLREFLDRKEHPAVKVDIDKNGEVWVELPLVVAFGFSIPDVAAKVQENVRGALEKMTSLPIKDININVRGVERP